MLNQPQNPVLDYLHALEQTASQFSQRLSEKDTFLKPEQLTGLLAAYQFAVAQLKTETDNQAGSNGEITVSACKLRSLALISAPMGAEETPMAREFHLKALADIIENLEDAGRSQTKEKVFYAQITTDEGECYVGEILRGRPEPIAVAVIRCAVTQKEIGGYIAEMLSAVPNHYIAAPDMSEDMDSSRLAQTIFNIAEGRNYYNPILINDSHFETLKEVAIEGIQEVLSAGYSSLRLFGQQICLSHFYDGETDKNYAFATPAKAAPESVSAIDMKCAAFLATAQLAATRLCFTAGEKEPSPVLDLFVEQLSKAIHWESANRASRELALTTVFDHCFPVVTSRPAPENNLGI